MNVGAILLKLWNNSGFAAIMSGFVSSNGWQNLVMLVIAVGKAFSAKEDKAAAANQAAKAAIAAVPVAAAPKAVAPGSAGELKLHDVEPKTAAMLMAIVADKMGKPLNELRFKSIKEVK